jgi:hypothetical protein
MTDEDCKQGLTMTEAFPCYDWHIRHEGSHAMRAPTEKMDSFRKG